jgi:hypothetical protein
VLTRTSQGIAGKNGCVRYYEDESLSEEVSLVVQAKQLKSLGDLDALLYSSAGKAVLVFKHSTT